MKFNSVIEQITSELIMHWNARDMSKFGSYLADNIVVSSPNITKLYPDNVEGKLYKKEAVLNYWCKRNQENFFEMSLMVLHKTNKVITCEMDIGQENSKLLVKFTLDEYGKFIAMEVTYV